MIKHNTRFPDWRDATGRKLLTRTCMYGPKVNSINTIPVRGSITMALTWHKHDIKTTQTPHIYHMLRLTYLSCDPQTEHMSTVCYTSICMFTQLQLGSQGLPDYASSTPPDQCQGWWHDRSSGTINPFTAATSLKYLQCFDKDTGDWRFRECSLRHCGQRKRH